MERLHGDPIHRYAGPAYAAPKDKYSCLFPQVRDIDFERGAVTIKHAAEKDCASFKPTKTYPVCDLPIKDAPFLLASLKSHIEGTEHLRKNHPGLDLLFLNPHNGGHMIHRTAVSIRVWHCVRKPAGLDAALTFHHIRRSYGAMLLGRLHGNIVTVSYLFGHSAPSTTLNSDCGGRIQHTRC